MISRNIISFFLIVVFSFILLSCNETEPTNPGEQNERTAKWIEDIDYFSSELQAKQFNFSSLVSSSEFENNLKSIKSRIESLNDNEIYFELQELLASFKIAHLISYPGNNQDLHFMPIITNVLNDDFYVIMTDVQNSGLFGKKLLSIEGIPISTIKDSLKKIISYENIYWLNKQFPLAVSCIEILKYYNIIDDLSSVDIEVEGMGNVMLSTKMTGDTGQTSNLISQFDTNNLPFYRQNESSHYWYEYLDDENIVFIKYNKCLESPDKPFREFTNEIASLIDANQVDKVIVDMRNNVGGSDHIINPLVNFLEKSEYNKYGKLFVAINNATFSSGVLSAITFQERTNCYLVGEPTGNKPNHYGAVMKFILPNSGITVQYCTKYISTTNEDLQSLFPDYEIATTPQAYFSGQDVVLDFIINYDGSN